MAESSQSNLCPSSEPAPKSNVLPRYMVTVQDAGLALMGNHAVCTRRSARTPARSSAPLAASERFQLTRGRDVRCPAKVSRYTDTAAWLLMPDCPSREVAWREGSPSE